MKWLTDHMLVRGINYFVPHAFSMTFPDRDCPPHFYARGNNPQFEAFAELMKYTEKMAGLLSRGVHQADAAILYHAEAEWSGGEMMLFQKPARVLMEHQLDYDVISADWLMKAEVTEKNTLRVGAAEYPALILPYCQSMDWKLMEKIGQIAEHVKVIMMDLLPDEVPDCFRNHVKTVFLEELPEEFECKIRVEGYWPHLRLARWKTDDGIICMFFNEGAADTVDAIVHLSEEQRRLQLAPGQSVIWEVPGLPEMTEKQAVPVNSRWSVSMKEYDSDQWKEWKTFITNDKLPNVNGYDQLPEFSGTIRYEGILELSEFDGDVYLRLPKCYDPAHIFVNGQDVGWILRSPDMVQIDKYVVKGLNPLCIEIPNTLVWAMPDPAATHMQLNPTGMLAAPEVIM